MRTIQRITPAPRPHWVGDGFPVRQLLSHASHGQQISPFLMLDYAGPYDFAPATRKRGVGAHPHRGFETVTIVYQGEVEHRDSTGAGGLIGPGDVQWMTAAAGIVHEEFHSAAFTAKGGRLEMVQLWVNLPAKDKGIAPGYQTLLDATIPRVDLPQGAGRVRVIAGRFGDSTGPAHTYTPVGVWDVRMTAGKSAAFEPAEGHTVSVVVLSGTIEIDGRDIVREAEVAVLSATGGAFTIEANGEARVLILSGAPINEPVAAYGPFVMNTSDEIQQAMRDFEDGKFGVIAS